MARKISVRLNDAVLDQLNKIPGATKTEKVTNAIMHQAVTAAIAAAVAEEVREALKPLDDVLVSVDKLRADVHSLDLASRETASKAATATRAVMQVAPALDERLAQREAELTERLNHQNQLFNKTLEAIKAHLSSILNQVSRRGSDA
jgi:ABC-type transporter Mla subunit MlaD